MTDEVDKLVAALQICSVGNACAKCPYDKRCIETTYSNAAMADAAYYIREASRFIKDHTTRRLTPHDIRGKFSNSPVYLITDPPEIDMWMFYVGNVQGLSLFRDSDGKLHDYHDSDYGKTWLAFTGRVTDKEWEQAKKEMEEVDKE